jgi:spore coat polysaccharide biosynthesis protein SpsF
MSVHKIAILQARMSSTRLPGKVLMDIAGKPLLQRMLERVRSARSLDGVLLATTTDPSDDILDQFCVEHDLPCYRGSLLDVLDRYYQAAVQCHADVIVRLTADCPLIDPEVLDLTVDAFYGLSFSKEHPASPVLPDHYSLGAYDFCANRLPPPWKRTLPIGLDVEVCSFVALRSAWQAAHEPYQREHVMPFIYEGVEFSETTPPKVPGWYIQQGTTPRGFTVALLNHAPGYGAERWTVDTPADLEFVRQVFARLEGLAGFTWRDVLALLEKEPELARINAEVQHKSAFDVDEQHGGHP